ncbi:hypothetical protein Leryth_022478 [Lithospermum erythrorhizon]|nr:hypothetical protein Leryth_022478 [Lithospermum erythrorhizon]
MASMENYCSAHASYSVGQIAYFVEPGHECLVECLPTCQSENNPPRFPPIKYEDYMLQRYKDTHVDLNSYK